MFDPEIPYESMNFLEKFLFDLFEKLVVWIEVTLTTEAVTAWLENFQAELIRIFGERNVGYFLVDLLALIGSIVSRFIGAE
ncbi:MAG: hypothetical protein FWH26_01375 [Oscillospiraceae bacterium]|nr:hypothetical protein [Oscillospiraceae bacterium]